MELRGLHMFVRIIGVQAYGVESIPIPVRKREWPSGRSEHNSLV
jgi:hypothetical protein